jgi:uncharacterized protein YjbI with pentapeptide repeats
MADSPEDTKEHPMAGQGWRRLWHRRKTPCQDEIKARAFSLSKIAPWRTPIQNWEKAERELVNPGPLTPLVTFWRWSGFGEKSDRKGLDAWISLSIPVLLFVGSLLFNNWNGIRQSNIASEEKKDLVLREYTREMKTILLDPMTSQEVMKSGTESHSVARALTLTTLIQLQGDGPLAPERRSLVFQFLREAHAPILAGANLSSLDLRGADLSGTNFRETNFYRANLGGANLGGANLSEANFSEAKLIRSNLFKSNLYRANLSGANLTGSNLNGANFSEANLLRANLTEADFNWAILNKANLTEANLAHAILGRSLLDNVVFKDTICPNGKRTNTMCALPAPPI